MRLWLPGLIGLTTGIVAALVFFFVLRPDLRTEPDLVFHTHYQHHDDIPNPERGFYVQDPIDLISQSGLDLKKSSLALLGSEGPRTLALQVVRLDKYFTSDEKLESSFLDELDKGLTEARKQGVKIILRFSYNDPNSCEFGDCPQDVVKAHMDQLKAVLEKNTDVIAVMQAGFIGHWGEWHHDGGAGSCAVDATTACNSAALPTKCSKAYGDVNCLDSKTGREEILTKLLDILPQSRMVQVRTPVYKAQIFGKIDYDKPLQTPFDGSPEARLGHHNDCFLASVDDWGTYTDIPGLSTDESVEKWKVFIAAEGRFVPVGGESCYDNANNDNYLNAAKTQVRTSCENAEEELRRLHFSYLKENYRKEVIKRWIKEGCIAEISRRFGYRIVLLQSAFNKLVRPGGILRLRVRLQNVGYAAMFNERHVWVVMQDDTPSKTLMKATLRAEIDPRHWRPGTPRHFGTQLRIPSSAKGFYKLGLWLPDESESIDSSVTPSVKSQLLIERPEYAVQFANSKVWEVWDKKYGVNVLGNVYVGNIYLDKTKTPPEQIEVKGKVESANDFEEILDS